MLKPVVLLHFRRQLKKNPSTIQTSIDIQIVEDNCQLKRDYFSINFRITG